MRLKKSRGKAKTFERMFHETLKSRGKAKTFERMLHETFLNEIIP